jgi:arylsulfatase A-like enzyme
MAALMAQRQQRLRAGPFQPDRLMLDPESDIDGFISAQAAGMLERMPGDRPWALVVIFSGPGNDLPPPALYDGIIPRSHLRAGFVPADLRDLDAVAEPAYPRAMLQRLEPNRLAQVRADYLGRVSLIDFAVRRLNRSLADRPDRARTWTVLASDRGHLLGEHGLVGHRSFLAGAVEVPVLVAPPRGSRPATTHVPQGLHSVVDVAATVTALAGCDRPAGCIGRSLLPLLEQDAIAPPLPGGVLSEMNDRLMLETERYKLVLQRSTAEPLALFDMLNDPEERLNLRDSPVALNVLDALKSRLADALLPLQARCV